MRLLALDTATEACSVAIFSDGQTASRSRIAPRRHADLILSMIDELLDVTDISLKQLDAIAYGCGPGSFTGVRIATGVAQGLGFAVGRPLIPVSTLAALAWAVRDRATLILPAIDARMHEVYCGLYQTRPAFELLRSERVCSPAKTGLVVDADCYGIGTGWRQYESDLRQIPGSQLTGYDSERYPQAGDMLQLARNAYENNAVQDASEAAPCYLRNKVTG